MHPCNHERAQMKITIRGDFCNGGNRSTLASKIRFFYRRIRTQGSGSILKDDAAGFESLRAWLARFRFGPAEWAWRTMTYGKPPAMRRVEAG